MRHGLGQAAIRCIVASRRPGISGFTTAVNRRVPDPVRTENMRRFMRITRPMAGA
jgi:hypothetical protein